jgi:hypothetical protein
MEGDKAEDGHVSNMKLLNSYGYYSHRIPDQAPTTTFEKLLRVFFKVNFRTSGSYAEF